VESNWACAGLGRGSGGGPGRGHSGGYDDVGEAEFTSGEGAATKVVVGT